MMENSKKLLENAEIFFRDCLQMDTFFSNEDKHYPPIREKEFLKVQFVSIPQITKYLSVDNCESSRIDTRCIKHIDFALRDPGLKRFIQNYYPFIIFQEKEIDESDKNNTAIGCRSSGIIGDSFLHYINYFLHCENRNCEDFLNIPNEIIQEIESFLKEKGRPIFGSF